MSDRLFFILLLGALGAMVFADCYRSHVQMTEMQEHIRKTYERCDREGIPRVRCRI